MTLGARNLRILAGIGTLALAGLISACTTVEGTNAMGDIETFEREVMTGTLQGIGIIPRENNKEALNAPRGPLVLPPDPSRLPAPRQASASAALPEDSDRPNIDTAGLTEEEIRQIRAGQVLDVEIGSGRPLTPQEAKIVAERIRQMRQEQAQRTGDGKYPLEMPPVHVFSTVGGTDYVCLADNGDLVTIDDPACPPAIREALQNN